MKAKKKNQEGSPTNNILDGNYRLRRAERWENIPTVSSDVGERDLSKSMKCNSFAHLPVFFF